MSRQSNVELHRSMGAPIRPGEAEGSEDSSILRYIKTLTSHQTNAKQQRLDRYLQQVKHAPESKPLRFPVKAASQRQDAMKTLKLPANAALQWKLLPREAKVKNERSKKRDIGGSKIEGRAGTKRRQEDRKGPRQLKKPKRSTPADKKTTVGSLDRFRLNGTWSLEKPQASGSAHRDNGNMARPAVKASAANEISQDAVQYGAISSAPSQLAAAKSRMLKQLSASAAAIELREAERPLKQLNTVRSIPVARGPWGKAIQAESVLPTSEMRQADLEAMLSADQDFAAVCDPLNSLMESTYF